MSKATRLVHANTDAPPCTFDLRDPFEASHQRHRYWLASHQLALPADRRKSLRNRLIHALRRSASNRPQIAGIDGQNQYVAARNRLYRPQDALVRIRPRPEIQENSLESHRQFYSQGQRHRAGRQALRRSDRREHPSRQGNPGQPDRNAPNQRRGEDFGALQDHRPGREGDHRGPRTSTTSTRTPTAFTS